MNISYVSFAPIVLRVFLNTENTTPLIIVSKLLNTFPSVIYHMLKSRLSLC